MAKFIGNEFIIKQSSNSWGYTARVQLITRLFWVPLWRSTVADYSCLLDAEHEKERLMGINGK